ncbi:signal-regulatory protein beta-1-like isoform X4 [Prinia subflava]|uniref:signal-regulatory protein beta-1-like isoform X4 n=1 Tax=Prinia subflava TaxID=208062 RepID=UPI002FE41FA8
MPGGSAGPRPPRADTKALITGSPTFPVPLPLFLRKVWEEPMAAAAAPLLSGQRSPVQRQLLGVGAPAGQSFSLQQPQTKVSVAVGEMLTLRCTTSPRAAPGPVRWLKGWGSGNKTIYDQKIKDPRVTRAVNGSDTDFTIRIRNVQPEDTGTYYCVKFVKSDSGVDEVSQYGSGTDVSVYVKFWMQRAPTCPARAARRRTTSTTPTCSPCPRPHGAGGARARPPLSTPASEWLPSDTWHRCLHGQAVSGWKKGHFCRAQ